VSIQGQWAVLERLGRDRERLQRDLAKAVIAGSRAEVCRIREETTRLEERRNDAVRRGRIAIEHIANADRMTFLDELGKLSAGSRSVTALLTSPPPGHLIPAGIPLALRLHIR
jgi:hypothetical protein